MKHYMGRNLVSDSLAKDIEAAGPVLDLQESSCPEITPVLTPSCAQVSADSSVDRVDSGKLIA